jgi:hypothetical protein
LFYIERDTTERREGKGREGKGREGKGRAYVQRPTAVMCTTFVFKMGLQ